MKIKGWLKEIEIIKNDEIDSQINSKKIADIYGKITGLYFEDGKYDLSKYYSLKGIQNEKNSSNVLMYLKSCEKLDLEQDIKEFI